MLHFYELYTYELRVVLAMKGTRVRVSHNRYILCKAFGNDKNPRHRNGISLLDRSHGSPKKGGSLKSQGR
jgi:hypothetical protein